MGTGRPNLHTLYWKALFAPENLRDGVINLNGRGGFFDSRTAGPDLPAGADSTGAYHIALKGVQLLEENLAADSSDLRLEHKGWFRFAQDLAFRKFGQA